MNKYNTEEVKSRVLTEPDKTRTTGEEIQSTREQGREKGGRAGVEPAAHQVLDNAASYTKKDEGGGGALVGNIVQE